MKKARRSAGKTRSKPPGPSCAFASRIDRRDRTPCPPRPIHPTLPAGALLAVACCTLLWPEPVRAADSPRRIFTYRQAEEARRLARQECKPLVIHFVPDSKTGAEQLDSFYKDPDGVPAALLDNVVVVVVPTRRYGRFARRLGITGPGGYRTVSAYDLSTMDDGSVPTCRSGFV